MAIYGVSRFFSVSDPRRLWLVTGAHAINEFYSVALPPILPFLVSDFSITYGEAGVLLTVFFVVYSIFQVPAGMLADRIGHRWILAAGMGILSVGIFLAAVAQGYPSLVLAQALAGLGGSTYHPSGMSLISDLETGDTEGKAMGIHGFGGVVGTALAPALIGGIAAVFDWRFALQISATVGIGYMLVFLALFRNVETADRIADGGTDESSIQGSSPEETTKGIGIVGWLGSHISVPLEPWVAILFSINLVVATVIGAVRTFVTTYLVEYGGTSTAVANGIFFAMLVAAGVASLIGGNLADVLDRRTLGIAVLTALIGLLLGTPLVPFVPVALLAWFVLLGLVLWTALPIVNAITSRFARAEYSGSLFGVMLTAGSLGGASGPLVFGFTAEAVGMGGAFPLLAGIAAIALIAFFLLDPVEAPDPSHS